MEILLTIGEHELTTTLINSLIVFALLILFFLICGMTISRADPTQPSKGFMAIIEIIYQGVLGFVSQNVGDAAWKYVPFIVTIATYLAVANLVGLVGLRPPTTDINITVALTLVTLTYIMMIGMFTKGFWKYLKDTYMGNVPKLMLILFIPMNIVGELSKIISLSFRLFGNIVSGALLLGLVSQLFVWLFALMPIIGWIPSLLLPFFNAYFDIFAGLMQTFIFCTLAMMWIKSATEKEA